MSLYSGILIVIGLSPSYFKLLKVADLEFLILIGCFGGGGGFLIDLAQAKYFYDDALRGWIFFRSKPTSLGSCGLGDLPESGSNHLWL